MSAGWIRHMVAEEVATEEIPLSVSQGLVYCEPDAELPATVQALAMLRVLSDALYQAKASGRDRWVWGQAPAATEGE